MKLAFSHFGNRTSIVKRVADLASLATALILAANIVLHPAMVGILIFVVAGGFVMFERPDLGVWLIILLTPLESFGPLSFTMSKPAKLSLTLIVAAALWVLSVRRPAIHDPYCWPFALALISGLFATILAASPLSSALGLASIGVFVLFYSAIRKSGLLIERGPLLLRIVLLSALLSTALCVVQLTQGYEATWVSADHKTMDAEQAFSTIWPTIFRASATFNGPNAAGGFFAIATIVALTHALVFRKLRVCYVVAALVCWLDGLMTFSRGSILGSLTGFVFAAWAMGFLPRRRLVVLLVLLAAGLAGLFASDVIRAYMRIGEDLASVSPERVDAWQAAVVILKRHPVFGIGFYQFHDASQGITGVSDTPLHPHNGLLKTIVEQGPLGGCAYLLFIAAFVRSSVKSLIGNCSLENRWVLGSIAGVGISFFVQELFDANFTLGGSSLAILFASMLGLQVSILSRNQSTQSEVPIVTAGQVP